MTAARGGQRRRRLAHSNMRSRASRAPHVCVYWPHDCQAAPLVVRWCPAACRRPQHAPGETCGAAAARSGVAPVWPGPAGRRCPVRACECWTRVCSAESLATHRVAGITAGILQWSPQRAFLYSAPACLIATLAAFEGPARAQQPRGARATGSRRRKAVCSEQRPVACQRSSSL